MLSWQKKKEFGVPVTDLEAEVRSRDIIPALGQAKSFGSLRLRLRNSENNAPHFIKDGI
jgi:hypothetical protein